MNLGFLVALCCGTALAAGPGGPVKVFILAGDENCLEQAAPAGRTVGNEVQLFLNATPVKDEVAGVVRCEVFKGATAAATGTVGADLWWTANGRTTS